MSTELGDFALELETRLAPITSAYFIGLIQAGGLDGTTIYRIATRANQEASGPCPIEVIQGGRLARDVPMRAAIVHEDTRKTGLRHLRWTVSTSRHEPGEAYGSFFICLRDEPALDYGGQRHPDGQGFAAFGRVTDGFPTLEVIRQRAESKEHLARAIPIVRARIL